MCWWCAEDGYRGVCTLGFTGGNRGDLGVCPRGYARDHQDPQGDARGWSVPAAMRRTSGMCQWPYVRYVSMSIGATCSKVAHVNAAIDCEMVI